MAPRLLDLYCKAGGASAGYDQAGFEVTGVDHEPQPHYPFRFVLADALEYVRLHGHEYDAIAASPPCQAHSAGTRSAEGRYGRRFIHPDLIPATRAALIRTGVPYIIENVVGAPLLSPILLCGHSLGLPIYRHRLFESNVALLAPAHRKHAELTTASHGYRGKMAVASLGVFRSFAALDGKPADLARQAFDIDWMTLDELRQAIPPAYTEFTGKQLLTHLKES